MQQQLKVQYAKYNTRNVSSNTLQSAVVVFLRKQNDSYVVVQSTIAYNVLHAGHAIQRALLNDSYTSDYAQYSNGDVLTCAQAQQLSEYSVLEMQRFNAYKAAAAQHSIVAVICNFV